MVVEGRELVPLGVAPLPMPRVAPVTTAKRPRRSQGRRITEAETGHLRLEAAGSGMEDGGVIKRLQIRTCCGWGPNVSPKIHHVAGMDAVSNSSFKILSGPFALGGGSPVKPTKINLMIEACFATALCGWMIILSGVPCF